ncbi:MAG: hypothetical protein ACAI25_10440, partial [Planctomycetota bacterium]
MRKRPRGKKTALVGDPVIDVDDVLDELKIPHVFAGSLGLIFYGRPRGTKDIDVVVHAPRESYPAILAALALRGVQVDAEQFLSDLDEKGYAGIPMPTGPNKAPFVVELIMPTLDFDK